MVPGLRMRLSARLRWPGWRAAAAHLSQAAVGPAALRRSRSACRLLPGRGRPAAAAPAGPRRVRGAGIQNPCACSPVARAPQRQPQPRHGRPRAARHRSRAPVGPRMALARGHAAAAVGRVGFLRAGADAREAGSGLRAGLGAAAGARVPGRRGRARRARRAGHRQAVVPAGQACRVHLVVRQSRTRAFMLVSSWRAPSPQTPSLLSRQRWRCITRTRGLLLRRPHSAGPWCADGRTRCCVLTQASPSRLGGGLGERAQEWPSEYVETPLRRVRMGAGAAASSDATCPSPQPLCRRIAVLTARRACTCGKL